MSPTARKLRWPSAPALLSTWLTAAATGSPHVAQRDLPRLGSERLTPTRSTQIVRLEGTVRYLGRPGRFTVVAAPDGRFVREVDAPAGDRAWFDGENGQFVDWNGMPGPLELYALHWFQLGVALQTGQWDVEDGPLRVVKRSPNDDGTVTQQLRHRDGPLAAALIVDESTRTPVRLSYVGPRGVEEISFRDPRSFGAVTLPAHVEHTVGGIVNALYEIETVQLVPGSQETFRRAFTRRDDTRFDPTKPAAIDVRRAQTGQVLVRPRIDGADLGWFVLDTGGGVSLITPAAAAQLRLAEAGAMPVTSVWGTTPSTLRRVEMVELGPVRISNLLLAELDLTLLEPYFGVPLAGLLGYDLFSRAVVEVEVATDRVAVFDPAGYREDVEWLPLTIHGQHPVVHARFDRGEGRFRLDLGAAGGPGGNVLFTAPAVEQLDLLAGREVQRARAGVGEVAVGAIDWFELAGHRFEKPVAVFHLDESGPGGDPYLVGNIGVSLMEPFRIVFDYARRRVGMVER